jgi:integrase
MTARKRSKRRPPSIPTPARPRKRTTPATTSALGKSATNNTSAAGKTNATGKTSATATSVLAARGAAQQASLSAEEPRNARSNRGRKFPPEPLRPEEVEALAAACNARYPSGARNRALVLVLANSGLRCAEALSLAPKDYDAEHGRLRVLRGKGGKHRIVPVLGAAATALAKWFEHRARLGLTKSVRIFSTAKGKPLATAYVRGLVKRLAKRAGIDKRVHVHGLRHTFAFESIRRGVKMNVLSKVLGHSSSAITSRYIDHLGDDDAVEAVRHAWDENNDQGLAPAASEPAALSAGSTDPQPRPRRSRRRSSPRRRPC